MEDLKVILTIITQTKLAERMGITKSNPAYWLKTNSVPDKHLEELAKIRSELVSEMKQSLKKLNGKKK